MNNTSSGKEKHVITYFKKSFLFFKAILIRMGQVSSSCRKAFSNNSMLCPTY